MRYAIISDVHANLHALEAVLEDMQDRNVQRHFCLGDIVGYGTYPNECIQLIRDLGFKTVAGNHDFAVLGRINIENFNTYAKVTTLWTRETLSRESLDFLESIPLVEEIGPITLVHGSLYAPELFDYVQTSYDAFLSLSKLNGKVCFIGHSHVPVAFLHDTYITYSRDAEIAISPSAKALINVGSVGQPRDQDPRASYAIYDDDEAKVWIRRIPYDIEGAIDNIRQKGLPVVLGERLRIGR